MKIITTPDTATLEKLERFVYKHPNGNFFQSSIAYEFFELVENYKPLLFIAEENGEIKGSLLAVLIKEGKGIKGFLSRRCIVYGGPIVNKDNEDVFEILLNKLLKTVKSDSIYIEFRNLFNLSTRKDVFEKNEFEFKEHYNFNLEINNIESNLKKLNKTRRWELNKSLKEGTIIDEAKNLSEVKEFYFILKKLYNEKVKKPLPDIRFFEQFFSSKALGKYFLVKYGNTIIGGAMCPIFRDTIYEWYECGLDKEYKNLYPGTLATWAPIEYAAKNGLKYFDFMGAGKPVDDYGVREFKSKFGGELVNYGRFVRINNPFLYKIGKMGLNVLGKIS